jgi:thiol-disulfide isomerase/thioredoxin
MTASYKKSVLYTVLFMVTIVVIGVVYLLLRDESVVQKRNNTPAAQALLPVEGEASFTTLQGEPMDVAPHFGTVIVATSWASWCPSCMVDIQKLGELVEPYKDKDVTLLAVNRGEDIYTAERYLQTITIPAGVEMILDAEDFYFKNTAGYAMPETVVFDKEGNIVLQQRGELRLDEVKHSIDTALE